MTNPAPTRRGGDLNALVIAAAEKTATRSAHPGRRWLMPIATIVLTVLGVAVLGVGVLTATAQSTGSTSAAPTASANPAAPAAVASGAPSPTATPDSKTATASKPTDAPISQLADPAWVTRIAAEGSIPERALAAYAGAALSAAQTNPSCGIGWNTLAAIGQVESAHGTINGSHLDSRGVATPTIMGIPLNGNGTAKIPDTDHGQLDGDSTWDHAVGPLQFIPSTWAQAGQDGNKDGAKDINQIDDAALAAALHLCEVGGDLTVPQNWINAISAYNASVDYNNEVATAATGYALLR